MIKLLSTLVRLDIARARYWFAQNTLAKSIVFLITACFFGGISFGIANLSYLYFFSLSQFEPYGRLTSEYLLHAALLVSVWFSAISSFILATNSLWKEENESNWLYSQPLSSSALVLWQHVRQLIPNTLLLLILWLPATLGFASVYQPLEWPWFFGLVLFVSFAITSLAQFFTTTIALLSVPVLVRYRTATLWFGGFSISLLSSLLIISIFPASLQSLLRIDIDLFSPAFAILPLNQPWFLTRHVVQLLTAFHWYNLAIFVCVVTLFQGLFFLLQKRVLRDSLAQVRSTPSRKVLTFHSFQNWYRAPLLWKEVVCFLRTKSETNFFLFFLGLIAFFFLFLLRALTVNTAIQTQLGSLLPFSLGALLFLATAFLLRLAFPLMAREGNSAWHTLTEPLHRSSLFVSKLLFGLSMGVLLIILSHVGVWLLPIPEWDRIVLALYASLGVLIITGINTLIGFWWPDWRASDAPDQLSTSLTGFLALGLSLFITGLSVWSWITFSLAGLTLVAGIGALILFFLFIYTFFFAIKNYQVTH